MQSIQDFDLWYRLQRYFVDNIMPDLANVGPGGSRIPDYSQQGDYWGVDQYNSGTFFFFVVPEDGTLFALRWL